jgi:hypothetical protein
MLPAPLRVTDSDYSFGIFKLLLFLPHTNINLCDLFRIAYYSSDVSFIVSHIMPMTY